MSTFQIDSSSVNSRADWRHRFQPGRPVSRVELSFPGFGERFVRKGVQQPADLVVAGFLQGSGGSVPEAIADLNSTLSSWQAKTAELSDRTVDVGNSQWSNMELISVQFRGPIEARGADAVRRFTEFRFRQLAIGESFST